MASGQVYVRQGEQGEQSAMMESNKVTRFLKAKMTVTVANGI